MSRFSDLYGKKEAPAHQDDDDAPADPNLYVGYDSNRNGRPVMGFYIAHKDGTLEGFMYHSLNHPKFQVREGEEFLTFTYTGAAIVMSGRGLRQIFDALMRHTLKAIYEYDGRPVKDGAPVITKLVVTQAGQGGQSGVRLAK